MDQLFSISGFATDRRVGSSSQESTNKKSHSSEDFANLIGGWRDEGFGSAYFAIGGADGHANILHQKADRIIAFGRVTWPHMLFRAMLAEQLYRASTILAGHPYHRGN